MPSQKRKIGDTGEREAESFLIRSGYRILDRNYRIKNIGEIDLVGERNGNIFFFEVKTRDDKHKDKFPIQLSINSKKRNALKKICELYILDKKIPPEKEWQVDGIFVNVNKTNGDSFRVEHLENILWEEYY